MAALTLKVLEDLGEWADRATPGELAAAVAVLAALQARVAGRLLELARIGGSPSPPGSPAHDPRV